MAERLKICSARGKRGAVLLAVLLLIAALGAAASQLVTVGHAAAKSDLELELLFVGAQFQRALESYAMATPAGAHRAPRELAELLRDPRVPGMHRHLRRIYVDPMTREPNWGLVRDGRGGIVGVHSLSDAVPFRQTGFTPTLQHLENSVSYRAWVFGIRQ